MVSMLETTQQKVRSNVQQGTLRAREVIDAQLDGPIAITLTQEGHLVVAEEFGHRIKKIDTTGACLWSTGTRGNTHGSFIYPTAIVVDDNGFVYVTDRWNHRVQKFDGAGAFVTAWGSYGENVDQLYEPWGITLLPDGQIVVVDRGNGRLVTYTPNGEVVRSVSYRGTSIDFYQSDQFKRGVHFHHWMNTVSKVNTIESMFRSLEYDVGVMEYPETISVDQAGHLFVTDRVSGHVIEFDHQCEIKSLIKSPLDLPLFEPSAVHAYADGLFIAEETLAKVYWLRQGTWTVFDVSTHDMYVSDIVFDDTTQTLYISDVWNNTITKCEIN